MKLIALSDQQEKCKMYVLISRSIYMGNIFI